VRLNDEQYEDLVFSYGWDESSVPSPLDELWQKQLKAKRAASQDSQPRTKKSKHRKRRG